MERMKQAVPEDVVFFWSPGLYVPKSEFLKWIDAFGAERIVGRDTESNGISACFGRLIRTFRSNGLRCESEPLQQYIEEDVRQHREAAELGVGGSNGFLFEWYGFFLHLMVHANYPWGGMMEEEAFYASCCEHLYGRDGGQVLYVLKHMLTIHESQLNLFTQHLPFAVHMAVPPGQYVFSVIWNRRLFRQAVVITALRAKALARFTRESRGDWVCGLRLLTEAAG